MEINIRKLNKLGLSPNQYSILYVKYYDKDAVLPIHARIDIIKLTESCYIKEINHEIILREKALELFQNIEDWIIEYRELFKGLRDTKSMGDKQKCITNMKWFTKEYPQYTKEDILSATERYINSKLSQRSYIRQADYFIKKREKDGESTVIVSDLLSFLEDNEERQKSSAYESI